MAPSCVNISAVQPDELPLSSNGARPRRGARSLGLCFQGFHCALTIVLLAVVIWLGVSVRNRRNDILFEIRVRSRRARCAWCGAGRGMGRLMATRRTCSRRTDVASPSRAEARARAAAAEPGRHVHAGAAGRVGLHAVRQPVPRQRLLGRQPGPAPRRRFVRPRRRGRRRLHVRLWRHQRQQQLCRVAHRCAALVQLLPWRHD